MLFASCLRIGLAGFGGVMPHARREFVERQRWVSEREMTDLLSLGQLLPGPNIVNVVIMLGVRRCGLAGAAAAVAGLMGLPLVIVLALGATYGLLGDLAWTRGAFAGIGAAAAGLILGMGARLAHALRPHPVVIAFGVAAFVAVAALRLPLPWVVVALAPFAVALAWRAAR